MHGRALLPSIASRQMFVSTLFAGLGGPDSLRLWHIAGQTKTRQAHSQVAGRDKVMGLRSYGLSFTS